MRTCSQSGNVALRSGQGRSKLVQALARTPFGRVGTARSWTTVLTLRTMATEAAARRA